MRCRERLACWAVPVVACLLCMAGCHRSDPLEHRLATTISDLSTTVGGSEWEVARRSETLAQLRKLKARDLQNPRILYAGLIAVRKPTLIVDYVDVSPRAESFRLYVGQQHVFDFVESDGHREYNKSAAKNIVLYTAVFISDSAESSSFWYEENLSVEIRNPDGVVSPRAPVRHVRVDTRPATAPE